MALDFGEDPRGGAPEGGLLLQGRSRRGDATGHLVGPGGPHAVVARAVQVHRELQVAVVGRHPVDVRALRLAELGRPGEGAARAVGAGADQGRRRGGCIDGLHDLGSSARDGARGVGGQGHRDRRVNIAATRAVVPAVATSPPSHLLLPAACMDPPEHRRGSSRARWARVAPSARRQVSSCQSRRTQGLSGTEAGGNQSTMANVQPCSAGLSKDESPAAERSSRNWCVAVSELVSRADALARWPWPRG